MTLDAWQQMKGLLEQKTHPCPLDIQSSNLHITRDGKIAIIDCEIKEYGEFDTSLEKFLYIYPNDTTMQQVTGSSETGWQYNALPDESYEDLNVLAKHFEDNEPTYAPSQSSSSSSSPSTSTDTSGKSLSGKSLALVLVGYALLAALMYSRKRMSQRKDKHTYRSGGGRRRKPHHKTLHQNTPHRQRTTRNTNVRRHPPSTIHNIP